MLNKPTRKLTIAVEANTKQEFVDLLKDITRSVGRSCTAGNAITENGNTYVFELTGDRSDNQLGGNDDDIFGKDGELNLPDELKSVLEDDDEFSAAPKPPPKLRSRKKSD